MINISSNYLIFNNNPKRKNKISLFFLILFVFILLFFNNIDIYAQFTASIGYSYVNMYSSINTSFLPYIGLSYLFNSSSTIFYIFNSFYYSLDNFFIDRLNLEFSYRSSATSIKYSVFYVPFNIFLINNSYYPGNFIFTKFDYQYLQRIQINFSGAVEYDQITSNLVDSPVNFFIKTYLTVPLSNNLFTNSLDIIYNTDDSFDYSLLKGVFSSKITFFPSINEMIIPKISILGGFSYNNTSGNYVGFAISNLFYSAISNIISFSSEIYLQYYKFLTSVLVDDIDYSEIKENLLFLVKYSKNVNSSHQLNIRLLYFPQELVPSNLNRAIIEFKNTLFYSSSNIFIIDFLSDIKYTYWFLDETENSFELYFEIVLKFLPNKNLTLLLLNDLSTTFTSNNVMSNIYAQIKFTIIYYILKNLSVEGLISYKSINNKIDDQFFEYFYLNLNFSFIF